MPGMRRVPSPRFASALVAVALAAAVGAGADEPAFALGGREYFRKGGVDVMAFQDFYPEGHQGAVSIVQHGVRVASNGDLRLEPTPGQWAPVPRQISREVDAARGVVSARLAFPDPDKDRKGFNPIEYPDLQLEYAVHVRADGPSVIVSVDLEEALPEAWVGRVGFNLELYPAALFGRGWYLGDRSGLFPPQPNGPVTRDAEGAVQPLPLASGPRLVVAPDEPLQRLTIESETEPLALYDQRVNHQNGWFIVRSLIPSGATVGAVVWRITPHAVPGWTYGPVVHVSQVGYHPAQTKRAVLERDASEDREGEAHLVRLTESGDEVVRSERPQPFGPFLRYDYRTLDFSDVEAEGLYTVEYLGARSNPFRIARDVFSRDVWQPTLEQFLPVQMCHMAVREKYKIWHGRCRMDDALMAPTDLNHFDGYVQGPGTLTDYAPLQPVPGLNVGGWHDAGDDDLRVESQAKEMYILALAHEAFEVSLDSTTIDQQAGYVGIRQPDGHSDILQQVRHGALSVVGAYRSLGRLYRGIITPTLPQYVMGGDVVNNTDGHVFDGDEATTDGLWGVRDDRLVFTEDNPRRELAVAAWLAGSSRALRGFDDALAEDTLAVARELWTRTTDPEGVAAVERVHAAVELLLATDDLEYSRHLLAQQALITERIDQLGWIVGRALPVVDDATFTASVSEAVRALAARIAAEGTKNPFGVPYEPHIWGAGWNIQEFGVRQYFLHTAFPELVDREAMLAALNFVLGVHPGENTASFASGVGSRSVLTAYGYNRMDWHYIPGGVVSGTGLIRPDFPELKDFPYLWQQAEYVLGGGATNFMFLALAADHLLAGPAEAP